MGFQKCLVIIAALLAFQSFARAEDIITTVFNVIESKKSEKILLLSGVDGRVYKYAKSEKNLKFLKALTGTIVRLSFVKQGTESIITGISRVNSREINTDELDLNHFRYNQLRQFAPTDIQSDEKLQYIFDDMLNDGDKGMSQCFKRAHMWAFDMWSKLRISSEKLFIFYTKRFIQLEDFEWWFHVASMVINNGVEMVMDGTFMEKPLTVKEWQSYFIKSEKINCPVIEKYQDYENKQWSRLCYLMKVPMYYFSPLDIENRDKKGQIKNAWDLSELQDARRAFRGYDKTYEALDTGKPTIKY